MRYFTRGYMCRDIVYRLYHRVFMITRAQSKSFFFSLLFFWEAQLWQRSQTKKKSKSIHCNSSYVCVSSSFFMHNALCVYAHCSCSLVSCGIFCLIFILNRCQVNQSNFWNRFLYFIVNTNQKKCYNIFDAEIASILKAKMVKLMLSFYKKNFFRFLCQQHNFTGCLKSTIGPFKSFSFRVLQVKWVWRKSSDSKVRRWANGSTENFVIISFDFFF